MMGLVKPAEDGRRTRTEDLRLQLADEILRGDLPPGTPLDEVRIAARYGVSRTPVREALRQLSASGLIEVRPHRGAVVARLSPEKLEELFTAMAELEAVCAGLAAIRMLANERRELERVHDALGELVRSGDPQRYHELNEAFHNAVYLGAHNGHIAELTLATRLRLQPFRRAQFRNLGRLARSYSEHDRVVQAILRGDRDGASQAMREHIGTVKTSVDEYVDGH
ncbi:GntR family transcriptional regulator [Methylobrevis albus]|uniref:GntR family transcriptional regulator n=1 Tax=Methylobrevis albus TaxID=2793297 RepID=A0A931HZ70_9HYPH|nr:GntR family transcriptional regulator [Methylobrevis albus]MBH0236787.1 GntR family transcriptional regulator [Methylobrevis albus]